jgi:hypothetical protein
LLLTFKKRLDDLDPEALKDHYRMESEENITPSQCAVGHRIVKMIKELGGDEEEIEAFLSSVQKDCIDKKIPSSTVVPSLEAASKFSEKEKAPISEIPRLIEEGNRELASFRADTEAANAEKKKALEDVKLKEETVRNFIQLELRLEAAGLTTKDPEAIVNVASNIIALGHDPKKIIAQFSKIKSFEYVEKRHQEKCAHLEEQARTYTLIYQLARWFVLNGYTPADIEFLKNTIRIISERAGITLGQVNDRLFSIAISYATLDDLKREIERLNESKTMLEKKRDQFIDSLPGYEYVVVIIGALIKQFGSKIVDEIVKAMIEVLTSPYYKSDPYKLRSDLKELRQRRRQQQLQLPSEQLKQDEPPKPMDGDSDAPAEPPALPEPTRQPEGGAHDKCEAEGAPERANTQEVASNATEQRDNQEDNQSKSTG